MNDNLIERLSAEWANLDPVDPLRGLIRDAIAALSEARAAIERQSVPDSLSDYELSELAHSANQEALSFGLSHDVFMRYFKTLRDKALAAAPQPEPVQEQCPECDGTGTVAGSQAHFPCPICTSPQEAQPLSDEQDRALCEAYCNTASDEYFHVRPRLDSSVNRRIFYAGHRKAWIECEAAKAITKGTT